MRAPLCACTRRWAASNLLYEMLMGASPFIFEGGVPHFDLPPTALYKNILDPAFQFHLPSHLPGGAVDLIMRLLTFDAIHRLGNLSGGADDVKRHPFFANAAFDWEGLVAGRLAPPYVPTLSSATDAANFEEAMDDPDFLEGAPYDYPPSTWDYDF